MMFRICFILSLSVFSSYAAIAAPLKVPLRDGYQLAAELLLPQSSKGAVLLLHQCNRDRKMWAPVVRILNERGFSTMTVDARGFGESRSKQFNVALSDEAYDKATAHFPTDAHDIYGVWTAQTSTAQVRAVVGASCGGAMASRLAGDYKDISALVLFSPALRPYWFEEERWAPLHARKEMPILGIVSIEDTNSLVGVVRAVDASKAGRTEFIRYNGRRHGEPLFDFDPTLPNKMAVWIEAAFR